jgi:putative tryptophan/tyrosine transport system substrate-binding protein
MRRRDFIQLVGGTAVAWPFVVRAQQPERMRLVGLLTGFAEADFQPLVKAFKNQLQQLGWIEGKSIAFDARAVSGDLNRMDADAGALVGGAAEVIVAMGITSVKAVEHHSDTIPVVFTLVADPVSQGLIQNLARPGGHLTGFTNFEFSVGGKWLELLSEINHNIARVTVLTNSANTTTNEFAQTIKEFGLPKGVEVIATDVSSPSDIESAIMSAGREPNSGLIVPPDSLLVLHREKIISLAQQYRLYTVYAFRIYPVNGGLMSYGLDFVDIYRQAANYTNKILRGVKPSELPVQAPNKFELVINLKTAKELGLTIPGSMLARADEVIE